MVEKHAEFVNKQITFQERQAERFAANSYRRDLHLGTASQMRELFNDFQKLESEYENSRIPTSQKEGSSQGIPTLAEMALKPEDIVGLPPEVVAELSVSGADPADFNIISVINAAGGILSLDRIVIGLFKMYGERIKRPTLTSRLNRMIPKGLLYPVPNRKGLYSTTQLASDGTAVQSETD